MQRQNKQVIESNSGASLVFVLAVMLLLMAIGTSALVAASAAAGAGLSKRAGDQLELYAGSLHKTVMYSLQTSSLDEGKDISGELDTLGGQILAAIYAKTLESPDELNPSVASYEYNAAINEIKVTPEFEGYEAERFKEYGNTLAISIDPYVRVAKERHEEYFISDESGDTIAGTDFFPREASINARVTVTVSAGYDGKSLTSVVIYNCVGGALTTGGSAGEVIIDNAGDWEFVSHEKLDR